MYIIEGGGLVQCVCIFVISMYGCLHCIAASSIFSRSDASVTGAWKLGQYRGSGWVWRMQYISGGQWGSAAVVIVMCNIYIILKIMIEMIKSSSSLKEREMGGAVACLVLCTYCA